jgi:hypothetical protein
MSEPASDTNSERATAAETVQEFTTKQRLRSLFDARNKAAKSIRNQTKAIVEVANRDTPVNSAESYVENQIKERVRSYCMECKPLLENTTEGQKLLDKTVVGQVYIPDKRSDGRRLNEILVDDELVTEDNNVRIVGISDYLETHAIRAKYGESGLDVTNRAQHQTPTTHRITIKPQLSENVFMELNSLIADLGIGLEIEKTAKESEFEYSDLI